MLLDRATAAPLIVASTEGGVEIETVAEKSPEKIMREPIDPLAGLQPFQTRKLAKQLGFKSDEIKAASQLFSALYRTFIESDCSMVEVNPLVVTKTGEVLALDAKFNFDDNALYRHPEIAALRDTAEEDPREVEASKHGLNYIGLDGNIACLVNGAGLAMATMDIIKFYGGSPANFLDVGGGATEEQVTDAFKILIADKNVKAILVNIFGGIMKCDVIAQGIINAVKTVQVVRCRWSFGWKEPMWTPERRLIAESGLTGDCGGRSRRRRAESREGGNRKMKALLFLFVVLLSCAVTVRADQLARRAKASAESYPKVDVIYDSVVGRAGERLRTIITRPRDAKGKLPVIFVAGWLSCDSVEAPVDTKDATGMVFRGLAQMPGFCLFRMDKQGVGDSEGDCAKNDFEAELGGYRAAFRALGNYDFIDSNQVYILGISNGGGFARWFQSRRRNRRGSKDTSQSAAG